MTMSELSNASGLLLFWLLLNVVVEISCWQQRQHVELDTLSCVVIIFSFYKFFVVTDGISANDLFQANVFSKGYNGKRGKCFFCNFDLPVMCTSVLLEHLLNLVTLDYMLLIKGCIVYHHVFVDGAVVFDRVGQPSESAVWQHLFCILY